MLRYKSAWLRLWRGSGRGRLAELGDVGAQGEVQAASCAVYNTPLSAPDPPAADQPAGVVTVRNSNSLLSALLLLPASTGLGTATPAVSTPSSHSSRSSFRCATTDSEFLSIFFPGKDSACTPEQKTISHFPSQVCTSELPQRECSLGAIQESRYGRYLQQRQARGRLLAQQLQQILAQLRELLVPAQTETTRLSQTTHKKLIRAQV